MCGIAGFINQSSGLSREQIPVVLDGMVDKLAHRGPDDSGTWIDYDSGVALGHRRLAVIDLSQDGHQPMVSSCGRFVLVFNGELYNYKCLRMRLEASAAFSGWDGNSDTEVMLQAMATWGVHRTLTESIGMFAFALWDSHRRMLYLGRDRLGEKPLYYGWSGDVFHFASELKALTVFPAWRGEVSRQALRLYASYNYVPAPYSIYCGIFKVLPGTFTVINWDDLRTRRQEKQIPLRTHAYWSARETALKGVANPFSGNDEEAVDDLDNLLREVVKQQMVADVPLGAFLSGGVDSSAIVALMQAQSSVPVKTFTIGVDMPDYNEAEHARAVAEYLGTEHTELYVSPRDALNIIPGLPHVFDEPFADQSQIPTLLVSKITREHVTVSLSGDGGDELFYGYNRYLLANAVWRGIGWMPRSVRTLLSQLLVNLPVQAIDFSSGWFAPRFEKYGRAGKVSDKLAKLAKLLPAESPHALYLLLLSNWGGDPPTAVSADDELSAFVDPFWADSLPTLAEKMMCLDMLSYLPDDILAKVDRAAMSVCLETRVPFLDYRVCEFAWRVPLHMKIRGRDSKWLLRQVLYKYVPKELIERPKRGFDIPVHAWIRGPLRDWAEDLLDESQMREQGFFDPVPIRRSWQDHLDGKANFHSRLWNILMFQAWLKQPG